MWLPAGVEASYKAQMIMFCLLLLHNSVFCHSKICWECIPASLASPHSKDWGSQELGIKLHS